MEDKKKYKILLCEDDSNLKQKLQENENYLLKIALGCPLYSKIY